MCKLREWARDASLSQTEVICTRIRAGSTSLEAMGNLFSHQKSSRGMRLRDSGLQECHSMVVMIGLKWTMDSRDLRGHLFLGLHQEARSVNFMTSAREIKVIRRENSIVWLISKESSIGESITIKEHREKVHTEMRGRTWGSEILASMFKLRERLKVQLEIFLVSGWLERTSSMTRETSKRSKLR